MKVKTKLKYLERDDIKKTYFDYLVTIDNIFIKNIFIYWI